MFKCSSRGKEAMSVGEASDSGDLRLMITVICSFDGIMVSSRLASSLVVVVVATKIMMTSNVNLLNTVHDMAAF